MAAQPLLKAGLRKSIGNGQNTLVWSDPWVPMMPARPAIPCGPSFNPSLRVSDFIDPNTKEWKRDLLEELVAQTDISYILSLRPMRSPGTINYCWDLTKSGIYTVKSGYALAMELMEASETGHVLEPSIATLQAKTVFPRIRICITRSFFYLNFCFFLQQPKF
ncbi:hypothetical protein Bca4012_075838 [Brassica carinata]|uniref:Uncharacterized protein n=1 Tax=Brassica carinata TaxID=52824 RepID=A0A8X7QBP2_BRACI|nr:hypothetical protein Bca52824_073777 [Brassica carinata]